MGQPKHPSLQAMKRPWKVPLHKNSKLQSCLALSLALHLLVLFGLTRHERVTQYPVLPQIMLKFTKRPPPQRSLTRRQRPQQRPLVRRPALQAAPVVAQRPAPTASRPLPMVQAAALRIPTASLPDRLVLPMPDFPARQIGPQLRAGALEGTRQGADEMTAQTQVHVEVRDAVRLDDPQLLQVPFVLLTVNIPRKNVPPCPDPGRESTLSAPDPLDARLRATFAKGSHALSDSA